MDERRPQPGRAYLAQQTSEGVRRWDLSPTADGVTIGRRPGCGIALPDDLLVSRDQAELQFTGGTWTLTDAAASRNGTYLNGDRLTGPCELGDGDRISVGRSTLTFHLGEMPPDRSAPIGSPPVLVPSPTLWPAPAPAPPPTHAPAPVPPAARRGVGVARILLVAGAVEVIGLLGNGAATFVTARATGALRWILPPTVAVIVAMVTAAVDLASKEPSGDPAPASPAAPTPPAPSYAARAPRRRTSGVAAVLVLLLVLGVGGFAVTAGVRYGVGYATGKESGPDRLLSAAPRSGRGFTVTVHHVYQTAHFTRVDLTVDNESRLTQTLPLYQNCTLTGSDGTTLKADDFKSQWSESIPPSVAQRGTITFAGKLPSTAGSATLSFATVFGPGGGGALTIKGLRLGP